MRQANPSVTELIRAVARHFVEDDCSSVAKALTYQTLFALVPTIALAYMVLTAFDAFQGLLQEFEAFVFLTSFQRVLALYKVTWRTFPNTRSS